MAGSAARGGRRGHRPARAGPRRQPDPAAGVAGARAAPLRRDVRLPRRPRAARGRARPAVRAAGRGHREAARPCPCLAAAVRLRPADLGLRHHAGRAPHLGRLARRDGRARRAPACCSASPTRSSAASPPTARGRRFGLVHADLRLANLLVDERITRVIDFDDCGFSWFMYDLGAALSFIEHRPDVPELVDAWVRGYRRSAPLSAADEAEIPTFILLRRLLLVAWIGSHAETDLAQSLGEAYTEGSCTLAEQYLSRFG
ncbi:MAG: phosphotransferase [Geminicoccaceae bacterium]